MLFAPALQAEVIKGASTIEKVELYRSGAYVYRTVSFMPKHDEVTVLVSELPNSVDPNTIRVQSDGKVKVNRFYFGSNLAQSESQKELLSKMRDSLETMAINVDIKSSEISTLEKQEALILNNTNAMQEGLGADQLEKLLVIHKREVQVLKEKLVRARHALTKMHTEYNALKRRYESESNRLTALSGQVFVEVTCKANVSTKIVVSYLVPDAWWTPIYDVRVENSFKPIQLELKAEIFQLTNEDWSDVDLQLFMSNPQSSSDLEELRVWVFEPGSVVPYYGRQFASILPPSMLDRNKGGIQGLVFDQDNSDALPFVNVQVVNAAGQVVSGTTSDHEGKFNIRDLAPGYYEVRTSMIGYVNLTVRQVRVNGGSMTNLDLGMAVSAVALEEVTVRGSRSDANYVVDGARYKTITQSISNLEIQRIPAREQGRYDGVDSYEWSSSKAKAYDVNEVDLSDYNQKELRLEYAVSGKQTIESSNQVKVLFLSTQEVSANYIYRASPRADSRVFLYAEIVDWEQYELQSAVANLFYSNTFVGTTEINSESAEDTLVLSLGPDRMVQLKREKVKEEFNSPSIGNNSVKYEWKFTVKSMKEIPIKVRLEDQVPISENSSYIVDVKELDGGTLDKKTGFVKWEFDLAPKSSAERRLNFDLRYPKQSKVGF